MRWREFVGVSVVTGILVLVVVGGFVFVGRTHIAKQTVLQSEAETPDIRVQGVHLIEQAEVGHGWELLAQDAEFYDAKQRVIVRQVRVQLLTKAAQPIQVVGDCGQIDSAIGDMTIQGHVQIQYLEEYTIETEVLHWDSASRVLRTDAGIKIGSALVHIAGMGLWGNIDQQRFVLQDDVHAVFQLR